MPITADTVTIAQYLEPEANVDLVTELTVNAGAEVLLPTPVGQNDNRMGKASFAQWILQTGVVGGALTGTPGASSYVVSNGTSSDATIDVVTPGGNAGLMSGADKTKLDGVAAGANAYTHPDHTGDVTSSGDGATTIAPDAVTTAKIADGAVTAVKLNNGVVNVLAYGADPTGVADSTAAFTTALATLKHVFVPDGNYLISSTLSMNKGQAMYGNGSYLCQLTSAITNGTATVSANGQQWVELRDLSIWGQTASTGGQNTVAVDFTSAQRSVLRNVHTRYCTTGLNVFDSWLLAASEVWIRECTVGMKLQQFNGCEMQVKIENCAQSFSMLSSFGSTLELMHEGTPQSVSSQIDACNAITFDNYYSEWTTDATVPDIVIGNVARARNIVFANLYRTQRTSQVVMLELNDVDGVYIGPGMHRSKTGSVYGLSNIYSTTALSRNVESTVLPYTDDSTTKTEMIPPVTWSNHYTHNYWPDAKLLAGVPTFDFLRNCTVSEGTTGLPPGITRGFDTTIDAPGTTVYVRKDFDLTDPLYAGMLGQKVGVGVMVKAPSGANWAPNLQRVTLFIQAFGGAGGTVDSPILTSEYIPDEWVLIRNFIDIPSDATELQVRLYPNNSAVDDLTGDVVRWAGLAMWIGGEFNSLRFWRGELSGLGVNEMPLKPQSLLLNQTSANGIAMAADVNDVGIEGSGAGAYYLGFNAAGELKRFDTSTAGAGSRKDGVDDLGTQSGSSYTVDFTGGTYDNKEFTLGVGTLPVTLSATADGKYRLRIRQSTGNQRVTIPTTTLNPPVTELPLNTTAGGLTVFEFEYDSTADEWHW